MKKSEILPLSLTYIIKGYSEINLKSVHILKGKKMKAKK